MISLENLSVQSGDFCVEAINLSISAGECVSLMGPSGSGKTTVMEAICGLRDVLDGCIRLDGSDHTLSAPAERNVGLVPQDNVLFPTMTVREQLGYSLRMKKWKRAAMRQRVDEVAAQLGIVDLLDRRPEGLSGGEAKRVAIGRAIASKPALLCLDESFTGLDDATREEVISVVKSTIKGEQISTLLITHSKSEAQSLAERHYVIEKSANSSAVRQLNTSS